MQVRVSRRLAIAAGAVFGLLTLLTVTPASAQSATIAGNWKGTFVTDGPSGEMSMNWWQEYGIWNVETGLVAQEAPPPGDSREVKVEGSTFSFAQIFGDFDVLFRGSFEGDALKGTLEAYQGGAVVGTGSFTLTRQP